MLKIGMALAVFNTVMEKFILPRKIKKEEGDRYQQLRFVTVNVVLHDEELDELNSSLISDAAKARIIAKGMRRNTAAQQALVNA